MNNTTNEKINKAQAAFTPGHWEAVEMGVISDKITSHGNFYVCAVVDATNQEDIANARLIACAPEMLAMLEESTQGMTQAHFHDFEKRLHALIAKAKGL